VERIVRHFSGETFDPDRDGERLGRQLRAVFGLMRDGQWRTLAEINEHLRSQLNAPEASASARLRDIRKLGWTVDCEYVRRGLHRYRVTPPPPIDATQGVLFEVGHARSEEPT
jgi:hypothetical protein